MNPTFAMVLNAWEVVVLMPVLFGVIAAGVWWVGKVITKR
jgi:hypothetical protein